MANKDKLADNQIYRNQRRKNKNVQWVLIPVFMVACLIAGYFFSSSSFFALEKILVIGNTTVTDDEIIGLSHIDFGVNIFTVNDARVKECLPIEPRIDTVEVKRKWPNTIKITVTERESVAIINTGLAIIEIDAQGRILDRYIKVEEQNLPLITGVDLEGQGLIPGCYIKDEQVENSLEILAVLPNDNDIGEINNADINCIKLYLVSGIEIRFGNADDLQEKYLLATTIIEDNKSQAEGAIDYVDVSIKEKAAFARK